MTPPPDNSHHLARWREQRRTAADDRTKTTIAQLTADGERVTFASVSKAADVSRSWLYASEHAASIRQSRVGMPAAKTQSAASVESNRARLEDALAANAALRAEVKELRRQLELALGRLRSEG